MARKTECIAMLLAGGQGSRLGILTKNMAKPAVPYGGKYRIIDFPLSNCVNSGIYTVGVLTQYQPLELNDYIGNGQPWDLDRENGGVHILSPYQQIEGTEWYKNTANAIYQNINFIDRYSPEYVLILSGDHIYKMDYMRMLSDHVASGAKCTVGCIEVKRSEADQFGIMAVNEALQVQEFVEKPSNPPSMREKPDYSLASMGIYVFDADYLYQTLAEEVTKVGTNHDFGKDILPRALKEEVLYAHPFERSCMGRNAEGSIYWRDVGTLDSYWRTHMDLVTEHPQLNLFDRSWPVRGLPTQAMPTKFFYKNKERSGLDNSLVSGGCIITDADIRSSVLFERVSVQENSILDSVVVLPGVRIGKNCHLKNCIIERECVIPDGMQIGINAEEDARRFRVSSSGEVVLVTPAMLKALLKAREAEA